MKLGTQLLHTLKRHAEAIPGAFRLYKWLTSFYGEGKLYEIKHGPMATLKWQRSNTHPFWYHRGMYEPAISETLSAILKPGDVYWDIGAHAGYHTLLGAHLVGEEGYVLAVEPTDSLCSTIEKQLTLNKFDHYAVLQAAVADQPGETNLYLSAKDSRTNRITLLDGGDVSPHRTLPVKLETLSTLAETHPPPDVIKMDVEGAEKLIFAGEAAATFFSSTPPRVAIISVHGKEEETVVRGFLSQNRYHVKPIAHSNDSLLATRLDALAQA